jgi:hypothetical protein
MGRHHEALAFHRLSAATFGDLGYTWLRAMTLDHLATAMYTTQGRAEAEPYWSEALTLLADFNDSPSTRIRSLINEQMEGSQ